LKNDQASRANQELVEGANQRLQIWRVRTSDQKHAEDNTGERACAKVIRG
jgi:hypothetical protein